MLSIEDAARELGESVQLTRWLVEVGRLPDPPTVDAVRAYIDDAPTCDFSWGARIHPGQRVIPPA